jgi:hypothetical protein
MQNTHYYYYHIISYLLLFVSYLFVKHLFIIIISSHKNCPFHTHTTPHKKHALLRGVARLAACDSNVNNIFCPRAPARWPPRVSLLAHYTVYITATSCGGRAGEAAGVDFAASQRWSTLRAPRPPGNLLAS